MIIVFLYDENNKYISKKVNVLKDKIIKEVKHKHCSLEKCYIHTNVLLENPDKYCYYIVFSNDIRDIDYYIKKYNAICNVAVVTSNLKVNHILGCINFTTHLFYMKQNVNELCNKIIDFIYSE